MIGGCPGAKRPAEPYLARTENDHDRFFPPRSLVHHRQPASLRPRDAGTGRNRLAPDCRRAQRRGRTADQARVQAGGHDSRRNRCDAARCGRGAELHRPGRVDAHLQPGQDVDRRPDRARQAAVPSAHAVQPRHPVVVHRHGLHEPQPVGPRRPRVRLHLLAASPEPQGGRRPLAGSGGSCPARRLDARRRRLARHATHEDRPLRRQHAPGRRHRRRQGRGRRSASASPSTATALATSWRSRTRSPTPTSTGCARNTRRATP